MSEVQKAQCQLSHQSYQQCSVCCRACSQSSSSIENVVTLQVDLAQLWEWGGGVDKASIPYLNRNFRWLARSRFTLINAFELLGDLTYLPFMNPHSWFCTSRFRNMLRSHPKHKCEVLDITLKWRQLISKYDRIISNILQSSVGSSKSHPMIARC